jgi:hypothetical protein
MVFKHLHSSLRVETLSSEEAANFNPQGQLISFSAIGLAFKEE